MKPVVLSWTDFKAMCAAKSINIQLDRNTGAYGLSAFDGNQKYRCDIMKAREGEEVSAEQTEFEASFLPNINKKVALVEVTKLAPPQPFADPIYRTKRNASEGIVSVNAGATGEIVFVMTAERYTSGGTLLVKNAELGDYIVADVLDPEGVIPEPYRAALCEEHPLVSRYIEKEFIEVGVAGSVQAGAITKHRIDTAPLNAKIIQGLSIKVVYHAVNSGNTREIAANYTFTKKTVR